MNYRSFEDLSRCIRRNLYKIPKDIDVVVGVPRSGLPVASMIALSHNLKVLDLGAFLNNNVIETGYTRIPRKNELQYPHDAGHILLVDDSVCSGGSMSKAYDEVRQVYDKKITTLACYATKLDADNVDVSFEIVPMPRFFEWNIMHRPSLKECCLDIDGVLCLDPTEYENDDSERYETFVKTARPLVIPSYPVGHLVTSRLEKYRSQTEEWLKNNGVIYEKLHMLDLPDAETRRRLGCHAEFKTDVYKKLKDAVLFIESDVNQSVYIAENSGKPTLCFENHELIMPGLSSENIKARFYGKKKKVRNYVVKGLNRIKVFMRIKDK